MSDRDRLNAILNKLGQGHQAEPQLGVSTTDFLTGILRIIDETVLARNLVLEAANNKMILHIAKRSLLGTTGIVDCDLAEADPAQLSDLGAEIKNTFMGSNPELSIVRPQNPVDPSAIGASVAALAVAWASVDEPVEDIQALAQLGTSAVYWADKGATAQSIGEGAVDPDGLDRENMRAQCHGDRGMLLVRHGDRNDGLFFVFEGPSEALILADISLFSRMART